MVNDFDAESTHFELFNVGVKGTVKRHGRRRYLDQNIHDDVFVGNVGDSGSESIRKTNKAPMIPNSRLLPSHCRIKN